MKNFTLFLFLTFCATLTQAQTTFACGYYGSNAKFNANDICTRRTNFAKNEATDPNMVTGVRNIIKQVGLARNFLVLRCDNIDNCYAINLPDREVGTLRYIVYDGKFLDRIENQSQTDWSSISILAHEIGHHLNAHTLDGKGSQPPKELEADSFSGFALYKLGATLEQAQAAMYILRDGAGSATHPPRAERLKAIEEGWLEAKAQTPIETRFVKIVERDFGTIAKALYWQAKSNNNPYERIKLYTEAIKNYAPFYAAYNNRGNAYMEINNARKAYQDFEEAIKIDNNQDLAICYYGRGRAQLQLGKYQAAINDCNHAIDIGLSRPELAYEQIGAAYYYLKDMENAKIYFQKALTISPNLELSIIFLKKME